MTVEQWMDVSDLLVFNDTAGKERYFCLLWFDARLVLLTVLRR